MNGQLDRKMEYAEYRLAAKDMLKSHHFRAANNRAYYAIFHAMRAVLALDGFDSKKYSGLISYL